MLQQGAVGLLSTYRGLVEAGSPREERRESERASERETQRETKRAGRAIAQFIGCAELHPYGPPLPCPCPRRRSEGLRLLDWRSRPRSFGLVHVIDAECCPAAEYVPHSAGYASPICPKAPDHDRASACPRPSGSPEVEQQNLRGGVYTYPLDVGPGADGLQICRTAAGGRGEEGTGKVHQATQAPLCFDHSQYLGGREGFGLHSSALASHRQRLSRARICLVEALQASGKKALAASAVAPMPATATTNPLLQPAEAVGG